MNSSPASRWRGWVAKRIKRRMKRRVVMLAIYLAVLQMPQAVEIRRDLSGQVGPTIDQLAIDLRKLTLIARAERLRREGGAPEQAAGKPCQPTGRTRNGQSGSIRFLAVGTC